MFSSINLGRRVEDFNISEQFQSYGRVDMILGTDDDGNELSVRYPNVADEKISGKILRISAPQLTDTDTALSSAQWIYNQLTSANNTAFQYQPFDASGALLDPSVEFGDSADINDVHVGIYTRKTDFGRLMKADISAPYEEEVDHEFPYVNSEQRQITRTDKKYKAMLKVERDRILAEVERAEDEEGNLRASLQITADSLTSEVSRAKSAESNLSSTISQTASTINARVTSVDNSKLNHTRNNSSFGWQLTASGFTLNSSGGTKVFEANSSGIKIKGNAEVTGKITATSGYIGNGASGFTIRSTSITNGKASRTDANNGVYIGTDGISLGANSAFSVDSSGNVKASRLTITGGSISIGDNFSVDSSGNIHANSGYFGGEVYAKNIAYGNNAGTFDGWGLTSGTVSGGYGGAIGSGTISTANTNYGINSSLANGDAAYYAINNYGYLTASTLYVSGSFVYGNRHWYARYITIPNQGSLVVLASG